MADVETAHTFIDGDVVHGADLNNIQDQSQIQPSAISARSPGTPLNSDYILYLSAGTTLKKSLVSAIPTGVTSVALVSHIPGTNVSPVGPNLGPAVSLSLDQLNQSGNTFLASPPGGASGLPFYRAIVPKDLAIGVVAIAAFAIDWTLGNYFYKTITVAAGNNFSFANLLDGQSITVLVTQGGANFTVNWPAVIKWENGVQPVLSPGAGRIDMYQFWYLGTTTLGKRIVTNAF